MVPTAIAFVGTALTDGATCTFLPSGDDTCAGAAAGRLFPTGGVLSGGSLTVRLGGPMIYKLCVAPAGSAASLDAQFTYVSSVQLTVEISPWRELPPPPPSPLPDEGIPVVPPPESAPSVSANKGMDIGPIAGGAGASLLLLALLGLVWKCRQANRAQTANSQSGYQLREVTPEVVTGVVVATPMMPYQKMSDM
jgi:hypothetical protein